jgi:23S rRNA (uridine2552-2'-O)-methyltransferase
MDHFKQMELCHKVVDLYPEALVMEGSTVLKAFQGDELSELVKRLKKSFRRVEISKPDASRKESSELYLVGIGFTGKAAPREIESPPAEHQSEQHSDSDESGWQNDRLI